MTTDKLLRRRVLVVEDEAAAIALDLAGLLREHGATVVGPAASVSEALRLIAGCRVDCALVDIALMGESGWEIPKTLADAGVPFLFLSGHSSTYDRMPPQHRWRPFLQQPYRAAHVIAILTGIIGALS